MENAYSELLRFALEKLHASDKFEAEIREALVRKDADALIIDAILEHLRQQGFVNDRRTAELVVERRSGRRAVGTDRLRTELESRGAPANVIDAVLAKQDSHQIEEARLVLSTKFAKGTTLAKAARFLQSRGFSEEVIESALSTLEESNSG